MTAFYNEFDPYAAAWLRNLIAAGRIAPGVVDERSIEDIRPEELHAFTQCHFFAGVGVWSLALRNAGWADDRPVWTGSCPCQPFSTAGQGGGFADERHLWPAFHHLIAECCPAVVLGEQVTGRAAPDWIDLVQADLEAVDYAFGGVAFPAAGAGAPQIRDRFYWVARAEGVGRKGPGWGSTLQSERGIVQRRELGYWSVTDWVDCSDGSRRPVEPGTFPLAHGSTSRVGRLRAYGNAINAEAARVFIEAVMDCQP